MQEQNAYSVLGIRKGATQDEIKAAWVEMIKKYDQEKHTDRFMAIQGAYETLRDPVRRAAQDVGAFNHIKGSFHFTSDERSEESDEDLQKRVADLEPRIKGPDVSEEDRRLFVRTLMQRSFKLASKRQWEDAVAEWKRVLEVDPTHQRARNNILHSYVTLGYSYAEHELYPQAVDLWEKALQMNPDEPALLHNLALAYEKSSRAEDAARCWEEVLRHWKKRLDEDPEDLYTQNCIVEVRRRHSGHGGRDEGPRSLEDYEEILKLKPNDFDAQFGIATILMDEQNWDAAIERLNTLSAQYPKNIEVLNLRGWAYLNDGQIEAAFQTWNRALTLDPRNHATREAVIKARMSIGRAFRKKGMHTQALVQFKALLRLDPKSAEANLEIGKTYMEKGDRRSAAQAFAQVMRLDPKNTAVKQYVSDMKLRG